jgi:hypothetical protein
MYDPIPISIPVATPGVVRGALQNTAREASIQCGHLTTPALQRAYFEGLTAWCATNLENIEQAHGVGGEGATG